MLPPPGAVLFNLDPGSEARLTLHDLDLFLLVKGVIATSTVVGGNLWRWMLAEFKQELPWLMLDEGGINI